MLEAESLQFFIQVRLSVICALVPFQYGVKTKFKLMAQFYSEIKKMVGDNLHSICVCVWFNALVLTLFSISLHSHFLPFFFFFSFLF